MYSVKECPYHAPCGICTFYARDCDAVCGERKGCKKGKGVDHTPRGGDKTLQDIRAGKGLEKLDTSNKLDINNLPSGFTTEWHG